MNERLLKNIIAWNYSRLEILPQQQRQASQYLNYELAYPCWAARINGIITIRQISLALGFPVPRVQFLPLFM